MNSLHHTKIDVRCEKCSAKLSVTLQQVADQKTVHCPKCRANIHLNDVGGKAKQALQKMDAIEQTLRNLSRK